jgi:hypothetical protein
MTDREEALRLGNYIIDLIREIEAIKGVIWELRIDTPQGRREIPLAEMKKRISQEEMFVRVSATASSWE